MTVSHGLRWLYGPLNFPFLATLLVTLIVFGTNHVTQKIKHRTKQTTIKLTSVACKYRFKCLPRFCAIFAHLTMPSQFLQACSLNRIGYGFGSQRTSLFFAHFANAIKFILKVQFSMFVQPRMQCETVSYQLLKQLLSLRSFSFICLFVFYQKFMNAMKITSDSKMIDKRLRWNQRNQTAKHARKS